MILNHKLLITFRKETNLFNLLKSQRKRPLWRCHDITCVQKLTTLPATTTKKCYAGECISQNPGVFESKDARRSI